MSIEGQCHFFTIYFQVLYVLCFTRPRYQVSVYRTIGPLVFCLQRNIQIGYGSQITGQMSCPLATDIFTALDDVIQDRQYGGQK